MTKPDGRFIYEMVELMRLDPDLGIKSAARLVLSRDGYRDHGLRTAVERLRKKYRRLRDADQLPSQPPELEVLQREIRREYEERPGRKAAIRKRRKELRARLKSLKVEVPEDDEAMQAQAQALERERYGLKIAISAGARSTALRLAEQHDSQEAAEKAAAEMVARKAHLDAIIPLLEELRELPPVPD